MRFLSHAALAVVFLMACSCASQNKISSSFNIDDCRELAEKRKIRKGKNPKVIHYASAGSSGRFNSLAPDEDETPFRLNHHLLATTDPSLSMDRYPPPSTGSLLFEFSSVERARQPLPGKPADETSCETAGSDTREMRQQSVQLSEVGLTSVLGFSGGTALASVLALAAFRRRAFRLSAWAAHNPRTTKGLLAGMHTVTMIGAAGVGASLASDGFAINWMAIGICGAVAAAAALAYPRKNFSMEHFTRNYFTQKTCDALLFVTGATMIAGISNHVYHAIQPSYKYEIRQTIPALKADAGSFGSTFLAADNTEPSTTIKATDPPKKKKTGARIVLIFTFALLTLGVSALSCGIACSGEEALALVVLVGLEALLILLLIMALKNLDGSKKQREEKPVMQPQGQT